MPSSAETVGGDQRVVDENAAGDDRDVAALAKRLRFADFEGRLVCSNDGRFLAAETQVDRPPHFRKRQRGFLGLHRIARNDDGHVRNHAHNRDIFDRLVRRAVGTDGDAGVCAGDLHVRLVERHDRAHLLPRASRIEHRIAGDPRSLADRRQTAGHRDQHLLGDADLDVLRRMRLMKTFETRRLRKVRANAQNV